MKRNYLLLTLLCILFTSCKHNFCIVGLHTQAGEKNTANLLHNTIYLYNIGDTIEESAVHGRKGNKVYIIDTIICDY